MVSKVRKTKALPLLTELEELNLRINNCFPCRKAKKKSPSKGALEVDILFFQVNQLYVSVSLVLIAHPDQVCAAGFIQQVNGL